jgi:hypothetical protein
MKERENNETKSSSNPILKDWIEKKTIAKKNIKKVLSQHGLLFKLVAQVFKSKLPHTRQTWKNYEAKFAINKIMIRKILRDEIEKKSFDKKDLKQNNYQ